MNDAKPRVLVVDDTEATRYAIARTLIAHDFEIVEAQTGREALAKARSEKPDLITLDIHLPDIIGFEVCRRIKQDPLTAHIPILQVSASFVTSKDRIHGLEGGADSYLTHPFEPPVLVATVKALLRGRRLNEDLRLSEERFRVALKNAPVTIYSHDLDLRYTWMHNAPSPLSVNDFIGRTDHEIFAPTVADALTELKRKVLSSGIGERAMITLTFAGNDRTYDLTLEPLTAEDGKTVGLTVAGVDLTVQIAAERAQKKAAEEADMANQAKSRFLANMSHEIRTPLGLIQGFADLALDFGISPTDRQEYLTRIKRNASGLTKLLGEILDLSKIEAGRIDIEKMRFALPDLVAEVMDIFALQARERGLALDFEFSGPFPRTVTSDPMRLRQILINLLSNALKFTEKGHVELRGRVISRANPDAPVTIEFCVLDSGLGLTAEHQSRLFQPFTQADSSTTRRFGGTGLGLNLAKKLAQALGGDLRLAKTSPGGSQFAFTFDAGIISDADYFAPTQLPAEEPVTPREAFNELAGLRVLLVEDSLDNQMLFSRYLCERGAAVDLASDGFEGVKLAQASAYDVILMDVQMPNLDGYGATSELRKLRVLTPIIALTAHAMKEDRAHAMTQGFNDYLIKPVDRQLLVRTVGRYRAPSSPPTAT